MVKRGETKVKKNAIQEWDELPDRTPVTLAPSFEDFEVVSERAQGVMDKYPQLARYKVKIPIMEAIMANFTMALREPTANQTGTPPDLTLKVDGPAVKKYHQVTIVGKGTGTTGVRTITVFKGSIESVSEVPFAKGAEELLEIVIDCLWDDTIAAAAGRILKIVDA